MLKKVKLVAFISIFSILFVTIPVSAFTSEPARLELSEQIVNSYLRQTGYPDYIIKSMTTSDKQEYYENQYKFQSVQTTYGIVTENYHIMYTLDENNNVIIDEENLTEFQKLMQDRSSLSKILHDKDALSETFAEKSMFNPPIQTSSIDLLPCPAAVNTQFNLNSAVQYDNADKVTLVQNQSISAAIQSATNFLTAITVSHISYTNNYIRKKAVFYWSWNYQPLVTDIDKVGMAWSGGFNAQPQTIQWRYQMFGQSMNPDHPYNVHTYEEYGYDDYDLACGIGKNIDIHNSFWFENSGRIDDGVVYYVYLHKGSLSTELTKYHYGNEEEAAIKGEYYHKRIDFGFNANFSFKGTHPEPQILLSGLQEKYDRLGLEVAIFEYTH